VKPGDTVLEVGIGTGLMLLHYPPEADVTGIDVSTKMLAVAQKRVEEMGKRIDLRVMDAQALEFPDETFDVVLFTLCLCTIPDPGLAVREGLRVCRPGGRLGFLEHVRSNLLPVALLQEAITPILGWAQHDYWNRRTADTVRDAGVADLTEERWMFGVFSLMTGRKRFDTEIPAHHLR
jgi:ubiquinone/menaquinone biosynthesis C-methylase UbiE